MKKIISIITALLIAALVISCIVAFSTCDNNAVQANQTQKEDDAGKQETSFYVRYNGEDVKDGAKLTFKEYDLNAIDIWGSDDYSYIVAVNSSADFKFSVNGQDTSSVNLNVGVTEYFSFIKTPTGFNFGPKQGNSLEYILSKSFIVDGQDAEVIINESSLYEVESGEPKCLYKLTIRDKQTQERLSIYFNLESASIELPGPIII